MRYACLMHGSPLQVTLFTDAFEVRWIIFVAQTRRVSMHQRQNYL